MTCILDMKIVCEILQHNNECDENFIPLDFKDYRANYFLLGEAVQGTVHCASHNVFMHVATLRAVP